VSGRKAIRLAQFSHGGWYCKSQARDQSALRLRIREIAHARPRFGSLIGSWQTRLSPDARKKIYAGSGWQQQRAYSATLLEPVRHGSVLR
jgi:hypothetical protein